MKIELVGDYQRKRIVEFNSNVNELDIHTEELLFDKNIHIICKIQRDGDLTRIEGEVIVTAQQECSRCLESFEQDIVGNFSIVVHHLKRGETIPFHSEEDTEKDEDSFIYLSFDEDSIDITENVHDALLLSIPLKPVCKEDCKGLCPVCGHNLNESDCGCTSKRIDNRWQALSGLLNNSTNNEK
jgi:uncharacterized protein